MSCPQVALPQGPAAQALVSRRLSAVAATGASLPPPTLWLPFSRFIPWFQPFFCPLAFLLSVLWEAGLVFSGFGTR